MLVVQDQFFQRAVKVIGLSKAKSCGCLVDDAVLDFTIHTARRQRDGFTHQCLLQHVTGLVVNELHSMSRDVYIKQPTCELMLPYKHKKNGTYTTLQA